LSVCKNQQIILPGDRTFILRIFTKRNTTQWNHTLKQVIVLGSREQGTVNSQR